MLTTSSIWRFLFTLILCLTTCLINARELTFRYVASQYELQTLKFNTEKVENYLIDGIEDNEGFIWFSGSKGIYAYDGFQFVHYFNNGTDYTLKKGKVPDESFGLIRKDAKGMLYIQERDYYSYISFDPIKRKLRYAFRPPSSDKGMKFMMSISDSNDMLGTFFDELKKKYTIRSIKTGKATKEIFSGYFNADDGVTFQFGSYNHWLSHNNQIVRVTPDGSGTRTYHLPDKSVVLMTYADKEGVYFLNNDCTRIYTWDKETDKIVLYLDLPVLPRLNPVHSPFNWQKLPKFLIYNNLIYLGDQNCFYVVDAKKRTVQDLSDLYNQDTEILKSGNELFKILKTNKGDIFLVKGRSVQQLQKKKHADRPHLIDFASGDNIASSLSFRAMAEDMNGNIYASYYHGIMYKKNDKPLFRELPLSKDLQSKVLSTYSLNYWNGYLLWNNLMYQINTGKYHFMGDWHKVEHTTQYLDKDTLWFYTWKSRRLYRYNLRNKKQTGYMIDSLLTNSGEPIEEINDIIQDQSGRNLWLATKWNGIALISKEGKLLKRISGKELEIKDGLGATVNKLFLSGEELWYGCADGLGLYNTRTGEKEMYYNPYNADRHLYNRNVYSLVTDSSGNFYLGTNMGIAYFDRKKRKFYNLPEHHSLASVEFNRTSAFRTSDNQYYFGSTGGLYTFRPEELPFNPRTTDQLRPIKIFNINIFNSKSKQYKSIGVWPESGKDLILEPAENTISVRFSIPEFGKTVYYSYRIREQSAEWKEYSLDNSISFYSLQAGTYTLEIKASTDLHDDAARFFKIKIVVNQVWHKLVWVRLLMLCGVIIIVVILMRWRYREKLRKQQELSNLRMKISMDLHDDVGSILSGLAAHSEMLSYSATEHDKEALNNISDSSRIALEAMRDIVWAMDNRKDKYENLIERMSAFAETNLQACNISHEFFFEGIVEDQFIAPEIRQSLYLIFKEAITNIIRHSDAKKVVVRLVRQKQVLYMSIHDNGTSPVKISSAGMGTDNMKLRAEKIGADFSISWEDGCMVRLKIQLPGSA